MVTLKEVPDEHFESGRSAEPDDDYTDTESEISNESDYDSGSESLWERLAALKMIIPANTRRWVSLRCATIYNISRTTLLYGGRITWGVSATMLLFFLPFAICMSEEQQIMALEQEQKQREAGGEMLLAGTGGENTADKLALALDGRDGKADAKPAL